MRQGLWGRIPMGFTSSIEAPAPIIGERRHVLVIAAGRDIRASIQSAEDKVDDLDTVAVCPACAGLGTNTIRTSNMQVRREKPPAWQRLRRLIVKNGQLRPWLQLLPGRLLPRNCDKLLQGENSCAILFGSLQPGVEPTEALIARAFHMLLNTPVAIARHAKPPSQCDQMVIERLVAAKMHPSVCHQVNGLHRHEPLELSKAHIDYVSLPLPNNIELNNVAKPALLNSSSSFLIAPL